MGSSTVQHQVSVVHSHLNILKAFNCPPHHYFFDLHNQTNQKKIILFVKTELAEFVIMVS